jgi:hypothetical protein
VGLIESGNRYVLDCAGRFCEPMEEDGPLRAYVEVGNIRNSLQLLEETGVVS